MKQYWSSKTARKRKIAALEQAAEETDQRGQRGRQGPENEDQAYESATESSDEVEDPGPVRKRIKAVTFLAVVLIISHIYASF